MICLRRNSFFIALSICLLARIGMADNSPPLAPQMPPPEATMQREAALVQARAAGEEMARQAALAAREMLENERKAAEEAEYARFDKDYLKSVVVIEGDHMVGTGFLAEFKGKRVIFSNAHVLFGNRILRFRTVGGMELKHTQINICRDRDIVAYELENAEDLTWLGIHQDMGNVTNQEAVVVFGNSAGAGVVTTLRGKMLGIGPDKIEIDAAFVEGNSGSPIIAYPYNAVVGMATYATQTPEIDWTTRSTRFVEVRRFGVRIDNVGWEDFFPLDTGEYEQALELYEQITAFAGEEVRKAQWQGDAYQATASAKIKAAQLLQQYNATAPWMRRYADDAALAAHVCAQLLQ